MITLSTLIPYFLIRLRPVPRQPIAVSRRAGQLQRSDIWATRVRARGRLEKREEKDQDPAAPFRYKSRMRLFPLFCLTGLILLPLRADDDGPPVSITSPDTEVTYPYAELKSRSLYWNEKRQILVARLVFLPPDTAPGIDQDTHEFSLPGVTYNREKGIFYGPDHRSGELIPLAKIVKVFFAKTVKILPNAAIRIVRYAGNITVILEALRPDDPALKPPESTNDNTMDINKLL